MRVVLALLLLSLAACNLDSSTPEATAEPITDPTQPLTATIAPSLPPQSATTSPPVTPTSLLETVSTLVLTVEDIAPIGERETPTPQPSTLPITNAPPLTATIAFPETFPDRYTTAALSAGRTLLVNYDVTLTNPGVGQVFFVVLDPNGTEVDRWVIIETDAGTREVPVEVGGVYEILAAFRNLRGNYSIDFGFR